MGATVKYQVASYSGQIRVNCEPDDENDYIIAKAKSIVTRQAGGSLPFGYQIWKVIDRD